ncbi:MAG: Uma2 family endonuclease [Fimbriiglobus sp.]
MPRSAPAPKPRPKPPKPPQYETLADLLHALGGIPPERVRLDPAPGTATEKDVIRWLEAADKRLYELVDGTLVEKAMSTDAAFVAGVVVQQLRNHNDAVGDVGMTLGADGASKIPSGLVRIPDVSFTFWSRLPGGVVPKQPLFGLVPDLCVEVLSPSNTPAEIARKLHDYFGGGARLAWVIDPDTHTVAVYTSPHEWVELSRTDTLTGGDVLPRFAVPVATLFGRLPPPKSPKRGKKSG